MEYKVCKDCEVKKPIDFFIKADGKNRAARNRCKKCFYDNRKLRDRLRKENPPPKEGKCKICKSNTKKWVLDHCHKTNTFRGYICKDCNSGMGLLKDSPYVILKSLLYLIKHKLRRS